MMLRRIGKRVGACWPRLKRIGPRCLLAALTGCRGPAAPYNCDIGSTPCTRGSVLARQVMVDSTVAFVQRPWTASWHVAYETAEHVSALGEGEFGKRVMLPLYGTPGPLPAANDTLDAAELEVDLERITSQQLQPAHLQLQVDGSASLEALDQLIAQATARIDVIMFQWDSDELGQLIAARLAAVAGPNLHVRILIDGGGNMFFCEPEHANAAEVNRIVGNLARHPYIEVVRIRNPFARYDHRKLVIVDGRLAWTGGRNFSAAAFFQHHDLSVVLDGPLVGQLQKRFESAWEEQGGQADTPGLGEDAHEQKLGLSFDARQANTHGRLLESEPGNRQLASAIYEAVDRARHHIYLENVYLTDSRLIVKLAEARRRGVDVRVVMTVQSTTPTINQSNRAVANRLLQAGVRVYLYPGMTHVKAIAVDGLWAYLGTGNFDALSLRHNCELGLSLSGGSLIPELEQRLFFEDMRADLELKEPLPMSFNDWLCEWVASICL